MTTRVNTTMGKGLKMLACISLSLTVQGAIAEDGGTGMELNWKNITRPLWTNEVDRTFLYAANVASMRETVSARVSEIAFWLGPTANMKWKRIEHEFSPQQLTDFFTGAIALTGPQSENEAVWGLYNPWWDAILFLDIKPNMDYKPEFRSTRSRKSPVTIESLLFVSGETLRGEPREPSESHIAHGTVMSTNEPLSAVVWRVTAGSKKAFMRMLPVDGDVSYAPVLRLQDALDEAHEWKRLHLRSVLRLKEASILLNDSELRLDARDFRYMLVVGSNDKLDKTFNDPSSRVLLDEYKNMPGLFRKEFQIYGCVKTPAGAQFLYINRKLPRLYATVTSRVVDGVKQNSLEWFDLIQAEELNEAWNTRAEANGEVVK